MNSWRKKRYLPVFAAGLFLLLPHHSITSSALIAGTALAAEQRSYGEKKEITTPGEARKALNRHFKKRQMIVSGIVEKDLYFEAEIKDNNDAVVDKVIIYKRTGRIRSIY